MYQNINSNQGTLDTRPDNMELFKLEYLKAFTVEVQTVFKLKQKRSYIEIIVKENEIFDKKEYCSARNYCSWHHAEEPKKT